MKKKRLTRSRLQITIETIYAKFDDPYENDLDDGDMLASEIWESILNYLYTDQFSTPKQIIQYYIDDMEDRMKSIGEWEEVYNSPRELREIKDIKGILTRWLK